MSLLSSLSQDPNVVVGLVSSALVGKGACVVAKTNRLKVGADDHLPGNGQLFPTYPPVPKSMREILDSIAEICALSPFNQTLACGMRRHDAMNKLEIFIASSTPIHEVTIRQVQKIWSLMSERSEWFASGNVPQLQHTLYDVHFDCSLLDAAVPDLLLTLESAIRSTLDWKAVTDSQIREQAGINFKDATTSGSTFPTPNPEKVLECMKCCRDMIKSIPAWNPDETAPAYASWTALLKKMAELATLAIELIGRDTPDASFDAWERKVYSDRQYTPLRHHIRRCVRLQRHLSILRRHALHALGHAEIFRYEMRVIPLPPIHARPDTPWPSTSQAWTGVREHIYTEKGYRFTGTDITHRLDSLPVHPQELTVHPELALVALFGAMDREDSEKTARPCNYIGIAGLACKPCSLWLRMYNWLHDFNNELPFAIKGSNNEWIPGWCAPDLSTIKKSHALEINKYVIDIALKVYFPFLEKDGNAEMLPARDMFEEGERQIDRMNFITRLHY